jgi:hypothetical protein
VRIDVLDEPQRTALSALRPAASEGFYLAGGTGLCLRLGHRLSADLDLFRQEPFDPAGMVRSLEKAGVALDAVRLSPGTVLAGLGGVRISLFEYPYALLEPPELRGTSVPVASLRDMAAMKIEAIASRGARKDFYDLYFICQAGLGLEGALDAFQGRFAGAQPEIYHRLRALTDFDLAEQEPEPRLLSPMAFATVKAFFEHELRRLWLANG